MRRVHSYADGGKIVKSETDMPKKMAKKAAKKKQSRITEYSGMTTRERQMKDMGLADGGKPKMKPHVPPKVKDPIKAKMTSPPGGPQTPGAKGTYPPKKMNCGGKVKK